MYQKNKSDISESSASFVLYELDGIGFSFFIRQDEQDFLDLNKTSYKIIMIIIQSILLIMSKFLKVRP